MKITENHTRYILGFVFLIITLSMCYVQALRWVDGHSDTAFLTEITESIVSEGVPNSRLQASTHEVIKYWYMPVDEVCESSLDLPVKKFRNQFDFHTYYILYVIAPLAMIFDADVLLPVLTVISFMVLLLLAYKMLRDNGVPQLTSILFCLLISSHPAWSTSIYGQIYVDRFFIPLASFFLFFLLSDKRSYLKILIVGVLCVMVVERAGIMIGIFTVAYAILSTNLDKNDRMKMIGIGSILLVSAVTLMFFVIESDRYVSLSSGMLSNLSSILSGEVDDKLLIFMYFSLSIAVFSLYRFRLFALIMLMLLPNILGGIGGAEKTGWLSHYHSLYLPFLVMLSASGFGHLYNYLKSRSIVWVANLVIIFVTLTIMFSNPYKFNDFSQKNISNNAFVHMGELLYDYFSNGSQSSLGFLSIKKERLRSALPENSVITTPEQFMPALFKGRTLHYYPVGIDIADYVLLNMTITKDGDKYYSGAVSYHGDDAVKELNTCLIDRMSKSGFDTEMPIVINNTAILSRPQNVPVYDIELVQNGVFANKLENWNVSGSVDLAANKGVLVNNINFMSQNIGVEPGKVYKYELQAKCDSDESLFRMQLNWFDENRDFITSDIIMEQCSPVMKSHKILFMSPDNASSSTYYIVGGDERNVSISSASLMKRLGR